MRFISGLAVLLLTGAAIFGIYYITVLFSNISNGTEEDTNVLPETTMIKCNRNATFYEPCYGLSMIRRFEWLAQPPKASINKLQVPAERIILTDTNSTECLTKYQCLYSVRNIQEEHMQRTDDIEYNFLMDTNGQLYEGRGWLFENGQLSDGLRKKSYWIAFIGNLTGISPEDVRIESIKGFIDRAVAVGKLSVTYQVYCSRSIFNSSYTESISLTGFSQCF